MENPSAGPKQRSPWVYALLGCGGLAALMCLGSVIFVFVIGKGVKDTVAGVVDPTQRQENAVKQLGAIPEGYNVVASVSVFGLMQTTVLTDGAQLSDGGFELNPDAHFFGFFRVIGNDNSRAARDFLKGESDDAAAIERAGLSFKIENEDIIKRGQLTVDGRKLYWLASRSALNMGQESVEGLTTTVLFDCPSDALHVGIWRQTDPSPETPAAELELAGTVADEAELARFLKPMNPCR
jgi:hypothetical protein